MKKNRKPNFESITLTTSGWDDYELIDSGNMQKLERFGVFRLVRFEPQAVWKHALDEEVWQAADATFRIDKGKSAGTWQFNHEIPEAWKISYHKLNFQIRITNSRHTGVFPEQCKNWDWIEEKLKVKGKDTHILNLFGYTGIASLFAARAGARITHVDASRAAVKWAQYNQEISALSDRSIRWMVDDVFKFVERESRRGSKYDGIILDPPRFGRGPKGEIWKFEKAVPELLQACKKILSSDPLFIYLTAYDISQSPQELCTWLADITRGLNGKLEYGKLVQQEKSAGRKINQAMFARWSKIK